MDTKIRMRQLIDLMKEESDAYYNNEKEILVSDLEYDQQFDELQALEDATGFRYPDSPTQRVSGGVSGNLAKVVHSRPMLSCKKTKDIHEILQFIEDRDAVASFKMDGLTIVARYDNGKLIQLITRGDGETGEDITHNADLLVDLPKSIPETGYVEVRGEGVISQREFDEFNADGTYSHPRSLASGTVRQDPKSREQGGENCSVHFFAFDLVAPLPDSKLISFQTMARMGFAVVPHKILGSQMNELEKKAVIDSFNPKQIEFRVDGVVIDYEDMVYGRSLGANGHHENCRIALKWPDQLFKTVFRGCLARCTRTGRISLTAVFDPVEIDGTTVQRATLHNLAFIRDKKLGVGDQIRVYKANMIIPAVYDNLTQSGDLALPDRCPSCGEPLVEYDDNLWCRNPDCVAGIVRKLEHFCSKHAMNMVGISGNTLEALVSAKMIRSYADLWDLGRYRTQLESMEGWGKSSVNAVLSAVEAARKTTLARLITAFGISHVGRSAAKVIHQYFHGDVDGFVKAVDEGFDFTFLPDFGQVMTDELVSRFRDPVWRKEWDDVAKQVSWEVDIASATAADNPFNGKIVVATGSFENFSRDSINAKLESLGAKAGSSVSKKTDYVIAGEKAGSKLNKAKTLGIPVLTEAEFLAMIGQD